MDINDGAKLQVVRSKISMLIATAEFAGFEWTSMSTCGLHVFSKFYLALRQIDRESYVLCNTDFARKLYIISHKLPLSIFVHNSKIRL